LKACLQRKVEGLTVEQQVDKKSLEEQKTIIYSLSTQLNLVTEEHRASQTLADQTSDVLKKTEALLKALGVY
jgi:hypothetical protein